MTDVELPEIEIDDDRDPFKRRIALLVVAITLFGTLVAVLEHKAGNKEEVAARDAQRLAVSGLGTRVATDTRNKFEQETLGEAKVLQRDSINATRTRGISDQQRKADAQRLQDVRALIVPLTPLLSDDKYNDETAGPGRLQADEQVPGDLAQLRQTALVSVQNAYGKKAGGYVAVITVLAVALFLVGLSLTVQGRFRLFLVVPGMIIAVACIIWTASIARQPVHRTPNAAIKDVAEGNRLLNRAFAESTDAGIRKVLSDAVKTYDKAIEEGPFFGPAYFQRALARFQLGAPNLTSGGYLSTTDPESLKASVKDEETALDLVNLNQIEIIDELSFDYVLSNRPNDAVNLAENVLSTDDKLPRVWLNLGVARVLQGNDAAAKEAYDKGLAILSKDGDTTERAALYAGALSDLEQVVRINPGREKSVRTFQDLVASTYSKQLISDSTAATGDVHIGDITFTPKGDRLRAEFDFQNVPKDAAIGAFWYFRANDKTGFLAQQDLEGGGMTVNDKFQGDGSGRYFVESAPQACPMAGEYRLDVYIDGKRVASGTTTVQPGDLGDAPQVESSDVVGVTVCHPADWDVEKTDPQALVLKSPTGSEFDVSSLLIDSADLSSADPNDVEDELIRDLLPGVKDSSLDDFVMGDATSRIGSVTTGASTTYVVAFYSPVDSVVRVVRAVVHNDDEIKPVDAMLSTMHFTDLPSHEQDDRVIGLFNDGTV